LPRVANRTGGLPDYVSRNRSAWDGYAAEYVIPGRRAWAGEPRWGIWGIPETAVGVLPDVEGRATLELGCGTAYVSSWLVRRGARSAVGVDLSPRQLQTARALQEEFGLRFPLIRAAAERVPIRDASFDLVISEYGAAIWSDPYLWIPEAARLLRPDGELVFLGNAALSLLCTPGTEGAVATTALSRDYFGMHRFEWPDDQSVEFHLGYGDWIRLLRANGFEIEDLIELRAPAGAETRYEHVSPEWARRWPAEEVWKARRR